MATTPLCRAQVLGLVCAYAAKHARRHIVLCDAHVPGGGLVRDGKTASGFPFVPAPDYGGLDKPQEAILKVGFSDGIHGRSKGGIAPGGWQCEHLPYLVELYNWGASKGRGGRKQAASGSGADEITWFAHQASNIVRIGYATPEPGLRRPMPMDISRCPAAALCGHR